MDKFVDLVIATWGSAWWVVVPVLIFAVLWRSPLGSLWKNEADRKRWIGLLIQDRAKARYARVMGKGLDWLDARLSSREVAEGRGPGRVAWSLDLLTIVMVLAVAYPVLAFVVQWVAGSPLMFGGAELVPVGTFEARVFAALWLGGGLVFVGMGVSSKSRWRFPSFLAATAILAGGVLVSDSLGVPAAFSAAAAFAVAAAGAVAVAGAFAVAAAFAFAFSAALTFSVAFAFSAAFTFSVAFAVLLETLEDRAGQRRWRLMYLAALLAVLSVTTIWFWSPDDRASVAYVFVFLGLFPIFNALADFTSVGLTRYLIRRGLDPNRHSVLQSLLDLIGGAAIFFALGCSLITYLHLVVPAQPLPLLYLGGSALLDLAGLFRDLDQRPQDMWWLFFMLFSTLVPTALHLMVGVLTLGLSYPTWVRRPIVRLLESGGAGSDVDGWLGSKLVCLLITLSIWLPCLTLYWIATVDGGAVLKGVIAVFRWYAELIGAI